MQMNIERVYNPDESRAQKACEILLRAARQKRNRKNGNLRPLPVPTDRPLLTGQINAERREVNQ